MWSEGKAKQSVCGVKEEAKQSVCGVRGRKPERPVGAIRLRGIIYLKLGQLGGRKR